MPTADVYSEAILLSWNYLNFLISLDIMYWYIGIIPWRFIATWLWLLALVFLGKCRTSLIIVVWYPPICRWVVEKRLDKLKFARQKQTYCYFSVAATLFSPELSDARMSWAKNAVLTTIVDDFYDLGGSEEELLNLIELLERYVPSPFLFLFWFCWNTAGCMTFSVSISCSFSFFSSTWTAAISLD